MLVSFGSITRKETGDVFMYDGGEREPGLC
jgi:hypothetical protein